MAHEDKEFPVERNATVGGVFLVDPNTQKPYKAGVTVQQVEGGFDPTGLSTEQKQDAILAAIENLAAVIQSSESDVQEVVVTDDQLPPVEGQATATKQDQILAALNTLTALAVDDQTFRESGTAAISAQSLPLPSGASTSAKQNEILAALGTLTDAISQTLKVTGTVTLASNDVDVSGSVAITNASIPVTAAGTFPVTLEGGATATKQDAILAGIQALTTAVQAPQPITDNGGSITVDGSVAVSGVVQVADNGGSLTVDGTVGATQSGTWNVGITGTPSVAISGPVTITDGSGPVTVDGAVSATISGTPNVNVTNSSLAVTGNVGITGTPTVTVGNASIPVTQSGTWTMNVTSSPSATSTALTPYRNTTLSATPQQLKSGAGRVYQYSFHNPNNVPVYIQFWNSLSANVTPGTTVPVVTLGLPAGSVLDGYWTVSPAAFSTGITVAATTSAAGTGAPTTGILTQIGYV